MQVAKNSSTPIEQTNEKLKIADAFSRAAPSYAGEALLQKYVARTLIDWLPYCDAQRVIDLGCGSGVQLPDLQHRYESATIIGIDLSTEMLRQAQIHPQAAQPLIAADIDCLPLPSRSCDIVFSSLAMQWCSSFQHALSEMRRVTRKGGYIALSTMANGSLEELRHAWRSIDHYSHANQYPAAADYYAVLAQADVDIVRFAHVTETCYFASFRELLMNLKRTGVNYVTGKRRAGLLTAAQLKTVGAAYEPFRTAQGLPLRFQVIYSLVRV